ncbi:MAG: hypothetical protein ACE5EX_03485, partial [Phycisphaerae bacterium]
MGDHSGFVYYGDDESRGGFFELGKDYSEKTAEIIDTEIKRVLDTAFEQARKMIRDNRDKVEIIAQALLKFETITGEEVNALIRGEELERPGVSDLLDKAAAEDGVGLARPVSVDTKPETETGLGGGALPQPSG